METTQLCLAPSALSLHQSDEEIPAGLQQMGALGLALLFPFTLYVLLSSLQVTAVTWRPLSLEDLPQPPLMCRAPSLSPGAWEPGCKGIHGGDREVTTFCQQPLDGATGPETGNRHSAASPGLLLGSRCSSFWKDPKSRGLPGSAEESRPAWPATVGHTREVRSILVYKEMISAFLIVHTNSSSMQW